MFANGSIAAKRRLDWPNNRYLFSQAVRCLQVFEWLIRALAKELSLFNHLLTLQRISLK